MPFTHWSTFQIRYDECDAYGHLFHANYARLMQNAAFAASAAAGYDLDQYNRLGQLWLVRNTEIEFLRPVRRATELVGVCALVGGLRQREMGGLRRSVRQLGS